jgi:hypothetical protein
VLSKTVANYAQNRDHYQTAAVSKDMYNAAKYLISNAYSHI